METIQSRLNLKQVEREQKKVRACCRIYVFDVHIVLSRRRTLKLTHTHTHTHIHQHIIVRNMFVISIVKLVEYYVVRNVLEIQSRILRI